MMMTSYISKFGLYIELHMDVLLYGLEFVIFVVVTFNSCLSIVHCLFHVWQVQLVALNLSCFLRLILKSECWFGLMMI